MQAGTSANPPQRPIEIIRANSDGEEVGGEWNEEPGVVCFKCPVCDLRFSCWSLLNAHARAHDSDDQFVCSLCGIRRPTAADRNRHEEQVHAYARFISHRERKEASRIGAMKMVTLRNVGSTFDKIQQAVREELERTIVVAPSSPLRAAGPEKRPLASSLPTAAKRVRVSNVAEVVTIEDSDEEQLPEDLNVSAPNSEPTANRKRLRYACSTCGVTANSRDLIRQHEDGHERQCDWECAVCLTTYGRFSKRNNHEIAVHNFHRATADKCRKEAVKIRRSQAARLYNAGTKLVECQKKARPSSAHWPAGDRNASVAELQAAIERKAYKPSHFDEGCPHCGFKTKSYLIFNLHVAAHTSDHSFLCSLCGTRWLDWEKRNIHEINAHFFLRQVVDKKRKEAIRIDATFRSILKNVGKNIEEVQQKALTSGSQMFFDPKEEPANEEVARRTSPRKRASVSPRKLCTVRPTANDAHLTEDAVQRLNRSVPPVPPPLPEPAACSHESLEPAQIVDLQEDLECALENPSFSVWSLSALLSAFAATRSKEVINVSPAAAARPPAPPVRKGPHPQSRNGRLRSVMQELMKKPEILYFNYEEFEEDFGTLPVGCWKNFDECSLLLLRLAGEEWDGDVRLKSPVFRIALDEPRGGHVLVFAKSDAHALYDRLVRQLQPRMTFVQLMAQIVQLPEKFSLIMSGQEYKTAKYSFRANRRVFL